MNERKLNQLLNTVRNEPSPAPPADFDSDVMRAIRREPQVEAFSLWDQLNALFPRVATVAVVLIGIFIGSDFLLTFLNVPSLADGVGQISDQWLFGANGF